MRWRTRDQDDDFEEPDFYYENDDAYDAPYVVIEKREAGVGLLVLGLALGAGAALLFAPQSGEETRRGICLLYTSPSPRDGLLSRMPSSA